jgi:hypothetical protein
MQVGESLRPVVTQRSARYAGRYPGPGLMKRLCRFPCTTSREKYVQAYSVDMADWEP